MSKKSLPSVDTLCFFTSANPPTVGHVTAVAQALKEIPGIKELLIIPPTSHVWGKDLVSFDDRIAMLKLTFGHLDPRISVSTLERDNHLSGYSLDTIQFLAKQKKQTIGILLGGDSIEVYHKWRNWEELLREAYIFVAPRDRVAQKERIRRLSADLAKYVGKRVFFLTDRTDETVMVSSTQARAELSTDHASQQVSSQIESYANKHKLYVPSGQSESI